MPSGKYPKIKDQRLKIAFKMKENFLGRKLTDEEKSSHVVRNDSQKTKEYLKMTKVEMNKNVIERQKEFRGIVFNFYGSKCNCCGETGKSFLVIDHVNNDGYKDRAPKGYKRTGHVLYRHIINSGFPNTYQILCWNCNWSKKVNKGQCEHKIIKVID